MSRRELSRLQAGALEGEVPLPEPSAHGGGVSCPPSRAGLAECQQDWPSHLTSGTRKAFGTVQGGPQLTTKGHKNSPPTPLSSQWES